MRVTIEKQTMLEQIRCEVEIDDIQWKANPSLAWREMAMPAMEAMDRRQYDINMKVVKAQEKAGKLKKAEFALVRNILAGMNGINLPIFGERIPETEPENADGPKD